MRLRWAAGWLMAAAVALPASPWRALSKLTLLADPDCRVEMAFRFLQPGEPLLITCRCTPGVREASVEFLGTTAALKGSGGPVEGLALLGIDLAVKPGSYPLRLRVDWGTGRRDIFRHDLLVRPKKFPALKLRVQKEFVTPPKSAETRILRENELIAWTYSQITETWQGDGPFMPPNAAESWANFGQRRLNNETVESVHSGVDLRVPYGDPVRSANAGTVVLASDLYFGGKTVILDHGLGVFSSYGHMSGLLVRRGDKVKKGQVIGRCGSTGRSTGPHLHWGLRIRGSRVDPEAALALPLT